MKTKALVALSEPRNCRTVELLLTMVQDDDVNVRLFVAESIGTIAAPGHFRSYSTLMARLNHSKTEQLMRRHKKENFYDAKKLSRTASDQLFAGESELLTINSDTRQGMAWEGAKGQGEEWGLQLQIAPLADCTVAGEDMNEYRSVENQVEKAEQGDSGERRVVGDLNAANDSSCSSTSCSTHDDDPVQVCTPVVDAKRGGEGADEEVSLVDGWDPAFKLRASPVSPRERLAEEQGETVRKLKEDIKADPSSHTKDELDEALVKLKELKTKAIEEKGREKGELGEDIPFFENENGDNEKIGVSMLPLTPPYSPGGFMKTMSARDLVGPWLTAEVEGVQSHVKELKLQKFQIEIPPLVLPKLCSPRRLASLHVKPSPQGHSLRSARHFGNSGGTMATPPAERGSGYPFSGTKTARPGTMNVEPLPLSSPSAYSVSISATRSRVWLTPPNSRIQKQWAPPKDMQPTRDPLQTTFSGRGSEEAIPIARTSSGGQSVQSRKSGTSSNMLRRNPKKSLALANKMEPEAKVRQAVLKSLQQIGVPGDLDLLEILSERLHDVDIKVRTQAVEALTFLIVPVFNGPAIQEEGEDGAQQGLRIAEVMASFRSQLLQLIEHRSNTCRKVALEGLKIIAKPGDFTCLNSLVTNIHQLNHYETLRLLQRIAMPNHYTLVLDTIFYVLRSHEEKTCEDEKDSNNMLRFYVGYLKEAAGQGNRNVVLKLVQLVRGSHQLCPSSKQACMHAVHGLVSKQDREIVFDTMIGNKAVRDMEIYFQNSSFEY
jgi:hypothetical protein